MAYLEVVMPVQTEHRFPLDLSVLDAAGSRITLADLRGQARAVAVYFMRTGTCPVCIQHARALARLDLPTHGVAPVVVVVVPGSPTHAARVRRILGRPGHRRVLRRRPSAPGRCRPRSTGRNAPTILPQRAAKG
jgi:hypothetical protein